VTVLLRQQLPALNDNVVALMLVAVQRHNNLGLSVNLALIGQCTSLRELWVGISSGCAGSTPGMVLISMAQETIVRECIFPFPYLWVSVHLAFIVAHAYDGLMLPHS